MAQIGSPWIRVEPGYGPRVGVTLSFGGTLRLTRTEAAQASSAKFQIQIWDDDTFGNSDMVGGTDDVMFEGTLSSGNNTFDGHVERRYIDVANSDTALEDWAELYVRMRALSTPSGPWKTGWVNSANVAVRRDLAG